MSYLTPNDPDFDGVAEDCYEEALFLVKADGGKRAIVDVHLCDCDEHSPSGYGWDFTVYKWADGEWVDWDGGLYWDFISAEAMLDFELPNGYENERIKWVEPTSPYVPTIDDLVDNNRMFTELEWERAKDVGRRGKPEPKKYPLTEEGVNQLQDDYKDAFFAEELAETIEHFRVEMEALANEETNYAGTGEMKLGTALRVMYAPGYGYTTDAMGIIDDFDSNVRDILADDPWFEYDMETRRLFDHWANP